MSITYGAIDSIKSLEAAHAAVILMVKKLYTALEEAHDAFRGTMEASRTAHANLQASSDALSQAEAKLKALEQAGDKEAEEEAFYQCMLIVDQRDGLREALSTADFQERCAQDASNLIHAAVWKARAELDTIAVTLMTACQTLADLEGAPFDRDEVLATLRRSHPVSRTFILSAVAFDPEAPLPVSDGGKSAACESASFLEAAQTTAHDALRTLESTHEPASLTACQAKKASCSAHQKLEAMKATFTAANAAYRAGKRQVPDVTTEAILTLYMDEIETLRHAAAASDVYEKNTVDISNMVRACAITAYSAIDATAVAFAKVREVIAYLGA